MSRYITLEIRCDADPCAHGPIEDYDEVEGRSIGDCKAQLRDRGWRVGKAGDDRCPACVAAPPAEPADTEET